MFFRCTKALRLPVTGIFTLSFLIVSYHSANQLYASMVQRRLGLGETDQEALSNKVLTPFTFPTPRKDVAAGEDPLFVLILSSTPRSGSTFLGEILATQNSSVYFFEPLHMVRLQPEMQDDVFVTNFIMNKFICNIDSTFDKWLHGKHLFLSYFSDDTQRCALLESKSEMIICYDAIDIRKKCLESKNRIMKLVRARIRSFKPFLGVESVNLKIVHLYRDPRGIMNSFSRFGDDWIKNHTMWCKGLNDDLTSYESLSPVYPGNLMQVNYEKLSRDPEKMTKEIFKFVYGSEVLPPASVEYLESHTKQDVTGAMSTVKKSSEIYQAWRNVISDSYLSSIENDSECMISIAKMKHAFFGSTEMAKNLSLSLFV